tara:strand:+ start:3657 stop:4781 length:1125 start_codon:yes stop_codon:yes gene_type:complete
MDFNFWSFLLDNLSAAGVIGGYVSISIIGVSLIIYFSKGKIEAEGQIGPRWAQPIIGGLFGVIPGCGGTIIVASMYKNKKLSFGGLFAAFITTLGEGSFVLLGASAESDVAANLKAFFIVNLVGFIVGVILGYISDKIGYEISSDKMTASNLDPLDIIAEKENKNSKLLDSLIHNFVEKSGFFVILIMAIFLLPGSIMALWGGGIDAIENLTILVTMLFTSICLIYFILSSLVIKEHDCSPKENIRSTLVHSILDISMVTAYVFVGLFIVNFVIDVLVGPEAFNSWMTSSAFAVVLIAALIGVTPGCGGMIAVAAAYTTIPNFPIAALIAAAIATSGDGIFPLLAENKKDAIIIIVASLAIALVVGYIALALNI